MPKARPSKLPWDVRAADVLAGRAELDAGELIDLVHEVNPTGRGRSPQETAARYAVKSRLQSCLITRFGDDIEVTAAPGEPGVVSLRHRYRRHDACHAVLDTLDEEARSWVQRELDLAAGPASEEEESRREMATGAPDESEEAPSEREPLAAGHEAQAAYDYERAGRCFSRAVTVSGGGVTAAVAFLSFTVDALAADDEALALEARLPAATLADPRVGLLLALAAARAGDEARALRHLARARDPRAAEVLALLARRAIDAGDTERAGRHLRAAEQQDPARPELRALTDALAVARAVERAPREAELEALIAARRDAEALGAAQAILVRWPESDLARRATRAIEERQREGAGRRHVAEAEEALARGEAAVALEHLHRALACPLPPADRERAIAREREVESILHAQAARARVEQVATLLAEADRARALAAYVELEREERTAVQARVRLPTLEWLDAIPAARPGGRVRAAVEAVLALSRASALVDKDPAAAAALIAHERLVEDLPLARSIEQRARAVAAEERTRRAAADLAEAGEALAGDHLARARAIFEKLDERALPEAARAGVAAFEAALAAAEARQREVRRFERLRRAGAFAAAREAALAMSRRDEPGERERWCAEAAAITEQARTRHAVEVFDFEGAETEDLLQHPAFARYGRQDSSWIADGGRELVLVNAESVWLFLRFVDLGTGQVVRGVRLRVGEGMVDPKIYVHAGGVTVIGNSGLFEIEMPGGTLAQRFERNWSRDVGPSFSDGFPVEGTRLLWGRYGFDEEEVVRIVDLDGEPAAKSFTGFDAFLPVVGAAPPRLVLHKSWYGKDEDESSEYFALQLHEPGGAPDVRAELRYGPLVAVAHPSGAGTVLISGNHPKHHFALDKLSVVELGARFELTAATLLCADALEWPAPRPELAPALDAGLVFVLYGQKGAGHATLVALRSAGRGVPLVEHYRAAVPFRTTLGHDRSGRRAFALVESPGLVGGPESPPNPPGYVGRSLTVVQLGAEPPALPESGPVHVLAEAFQNLNWCGLYMSNKAVYVYVDLRKLAPAEREAAITRMEEEHAANAEKTVELVHALLSGQWFDAAARVLARAQATHPANPGVKVGPIAMLAARRAWAELREALDAGRDLFEVPFIQHYHHLEATLHARAGDLDEARRHLALADAFTGNFAQGHCSHRLLMLRQALQTFTGEDGDLAFDRPTSGQLTAVIRAADAHLARGDAAAAIAVLERPVTWDLREVHSLGRLATAYLELATPSPAARFRKSLALATFAECADEEHGANRREGLAPGLAWPEVRIATLRKTAVAWLEAEEDATGA